MSLALFDYKVKLQVVNCCSESIHQEIRVDVQLSDGVMIAKQQF